MVNIFTKKVQWNRSLPPRGMGGIETLLANVTISLFMPLLICLYPCDALNYAIKWAANKTMQVVRPAVTDVMWAIASAMDKKGADDGHRRA